MSDRKYPGNTAVSVLTNVDNWRAFYGKRQASLGRYPTEWVVRTLAGGNYPGLRMDKSIYPGARILDMGCGDGRNLPLLLDLGFSVDACELSEELISPLKSLAETASWAVRFKAGANHNLPYPDAYFDYMLCCASCYYLDEQVSWPQVRAELSRVLKPGGVLVANFCDEENFILKDSILQTDGSTLICNDPYGLRNGSRFMVVRDRSHLTKILQPQFSPLGIGHLSDDFYGINVSGHIVVAQKQDVV